MRSTLMATGVALTLALTACSSGSHGSPRAGGSPSTAAASSPARSGTKAACAKVQADLRNAPQALAPGTANPQGSLQAARKLADRIEADVRDSDSPQLKSAVAGVAQVFRDIARAGASGDTSGLVANITKVGEYGRQVAQICAGATG